MRRPRPLRWTLIAALAASTACPTEDPGFGVDDDDATPAPPSQLDFGLPEDSLLGDEILATVRVPGYGGAASFFYVGGELPPGLRVSANGVIEGRLEARGTYTFSIQATEMTIPDIVDEASITVELDGAKLHLGVVHDRPTTLTAERGLQYDPWMRIQAEGAPEMTEITLDVGTYHPGLNGENDGGWVDDIRIETVPISACTVTLSDWVVPDDADCNENDRPPHCVDDDPMTYAGDGRFVTGDDTGHYEVHLDCAPYGTADVRVLAVPPGWCPLGDHYGGPPWQAPGACEPG